MAKTPATVERFRLHVETSKEQMGFVLAELTKLGLQNIGHELITDIVTFRKNGARKLHEVTGEDFAREFIKENASFAAVQLVRHFKSNDRTDGSAYKAISILRKTGEIKKLSLGNYQRAGVKALPAPKADASKKKTKRPANPVHSYEIGNREMIIKRIKGRRRFTTKVLRDHFANIKRNPHSVSPITTKLAQAGIITMIEPGTYAWGNVKKKKVAKKTQAAVRKKRDEPVAQASPSLERTNG